MKPSFLHIARIVLIIIFSLAVTRFARAQYTFGAQQQSTPSAVLTYNSGTGAFQYTDAANLTDDNSLLPLTGNAATLVTTANGWTASVTANLAARSMTSTGTNTPDVGIALGVLFSSGGNSYNVDIDVHQENNTGSTNNTDNPNGIYGTLTSFEASINGGNPTTTTPLGASLNYLGTSYQILSGGTSASAATESINSATGVLSLSFNASTQTLTGYFNGAPVGSYSLAGLGPNLSLTLAVGGFSGEGINVGAGTATATNFSASNVGIVLHSFGDGTVPDDGNEPATLVQGTNGNFFGTTSLGGVAGAGCVFEITPSGTVSILHSFGDGSVPNDGTDPAVGLLEGTDGNFYGTTATGGSAENGTVFEMTPQGSVTIMHSFGDGSVTNDGADPQSSLTQGADGNFYGATQNGGSAGNGTVFRITPSGTVTILHSFGDGSVTNDGSQPEAAVIQGTDDNFYGTTQLGGSAGAGTVFKITPSGTVTILHSFGDGSVTNDGTSPGAALLQASDGSFYSTTQLGGSANKGTAFKITGQGAVTTLHSFGDGSVTNDGAQPNTALILGADGNFYGTGEGGSAGFGTVFRITPQGVVTILHSFGDGSVANDGANPQDALVLGADGNFYGTTNVGGSAADGTVFRLAPGLSNLTSSAGVSGNVGLPLTYQVTGSNTPTSYAAANLPDGLSIDAVAGVISGTPTTVGTTTATLTLTNAAGSNSFPLTIAIAPLPVPQVVSILTAYGSVGTAFTYQTVAINNATGYSATGLNGSGLSIDPSSGIISGMPSGGETLSVSLTATNDSGPGNPVTLSIKIFATPPSPSQEYNVLHRFNDGSVPSDGQNPISIFRAFDGTLYGLTMLGGNTNDGAVFNTTIQGSTRIVASANTSGGSSPVPVVLVGLIQGSDGNFYFTTEHGGVTTSNGNFEKVTPQGAHALLHNFSDGSVTNDGADPKDAVLQGFDGNFYGTTQAGGSNNTGTVFKITPQGLATILHSFGDGSVAQDGAAPVAALVQGSDGNFYGTTPGGGMASAGTVFKITPVGTVTILHSFGDGSVVDDGASPVAALVQGFDGNFYGTTPSGGSAGAGAVFSITPGGTVTILHSFGDGSVTSDGASPSAALIQGLDQNFYGTTQDGGSAGAGTVFSITPGGAVTIIHSFGDGSVTNDGANPAGALCEDNDGNFYGTTLNGGAGFGTIFSVVPTQTPTHLPIFTGSAYAVSGLYTPFSYTPKAAFGVSGSGVEIGNSVKPSGKQDAAGSLHPQSIRPSFGATNWILTQGDTPSTMLPQNMIFDSTSGTISGMPVASGTFTVSMAPHNALGSGSSVTITLFIDVTPGISSSVAVMDTVGTPFNYLIETLPPADTYGATFLPGWLSVDTATGLISGTPPASGGYDFNAVATNISGQLIQPIALTVTGGPTGSPTITSSLTASGAVGVPFSYHITTAPAAMSYTALLLPTGLLFDAPNGIILGTPDVMGTFMIHLTAANGAGTYASVLALTVGPPAAPSIANPLSATALKNVPFRYQIPAVGVVSSYAVAGLLPAGLSCDPLSGVISGVPTVAGAFPVSLTVANGMGTAGSMLTVNVSSSATFSEWETANDFTSGLNGLTDTPENDGVPNLLKYLYNINPTAPMSATDRAALPTLGTTTTGGIDYLTLNYRQYALATGITVNVQTSPDLVNWTTVNPPDLSQQIGTDPNTGDPIMQVGVQAAGTRQFLRLDVTSP